MITHDLKLRIVTLYLAIMMILLTDFANAVDFSYSQYTVFKGDVNGDAYEDIYLQRKDKIIIIASSPIIPIAINVDESYALYGASDGFYSAPVLNNSVDTSSLIEQTTGISFEDFNNDGLNDVVIQAHQAGDQTVLLTGTSASNAPAVLQQFSTIYGQDVSLSNAIISMEDVDSDGYADFVVSWVGGGSSSLINSGNGQFAFDPPAGRRVIFVHTDLLGSPAAESDENGALLQ